jgi:cobalt-zinc-cadmium efflux system outer membrane protein
LPHRFTDLESTLFRLLILWLLLATSQTYAQGAPPEGPALTLPQAAERVLQQNPRLQSAQFAREAAATRADDAALKPQWSVALDVENILGTGPLSGFDGSETTLSLSRIFQVRDTRDARVAAASAFGKTIDNELESERLDLLALLAERFIDVIHRQERLRLATESVGVWQAANELATARERAGAAPAVDRLRTEIRVADAKLSEEGAEHELHAARMLLASTWGGGRKDVGRAAAALCRLQELPPYEELAARVSENPDLLRFATEQRLREAEARLAVARQRPDWRVSAGVRHLEGIGEQALVLGVSVPLGATSRAAPAKQRAEALGRESVLRREAEELEARAVVYNLYEEVGHTVRTVEVFDTEILPRAREIRSEIERGYSVGRFSHTALINAQAELLAAASARLDACADHHRLLVSIERLTGGESVSTANNAEVSP